VNITFYCDGRGAHDRAVPEQVARSFPSIPGRRGGSVEVGLRCPVCDLGPKKIGYKKRRQLADAGLTEVNISALPF
jgi:hypothetical protein